MNTSSKPQFENERFGLFALIESRRVILPLKGVECEFSVRGSVAEVCMSQIFRQENRNPLDCEYLFPLPADASVYFCEADVNGRIIRAEIKELGEARKIVAEKKAEGFRTALVESVRDNLFSLNLGNVQPDDLIVIRLKYFQALRAVDKNRSLEIPLCPGIRYIPGRPLLRSNSGNGVADDTDEVPDASRLSPVRIDALHPDAAYIDVRGKLDAIHTLQESLACPSHTIDVNASSEELSLTLAEKSEVPERNFLLRWREANTEAIAPRAWTRMSGKEEYALLELRAPENISARDTALDFYFLVDRSGSMQGAKWSKAVEALRSCLNVLGPDDRVMVTLFESTFRDFAERPLPVAELLQDPNFQTMQRMGANGGTQMVPALAHVLQIAGRHSRGRDRNLILITDAQIGNDAAILELMKSAPDMPVHCFGIDIALNDTLLLALSRQQGGTFHSLNPNDDIQGLVTALGKTLRRPALLDLQLSEGWECAEARIPNLYAGQFLYLSARAGGEIPLSLTGRTPAGEPITLNFQRQAVAGEAPRLHWCKARIQRLLAEGREREAIGLSVSNNLLCRLTAFVSWDDSEKVAVSRHELIQPNITTFRKASSVRRMAGDGIRSKAGEALQELAGLDQAGQNPPVHRTDLVHRLCDHLQSPGGVRSQDNESEAAASYRRSYPIQALVTVMLRIGANDWHSHVRMITIWLMGVGPNDRSERIETLNRLIQKLNLCAGLLEILLGACAALDSSWIKHLRVCQLEFRKSQQQWKARASELNDVAKLFQQAELLDASASRETLATLAAHVQRQAIEMFKAFADGLRP